MVNLNGKMFEKLIFRKLLKPNSLFSLDMSMTINECQRSMLTFQPRSFILESHHYMIKNIFSKTLRRIKLKFNIIDPGMGVDPLRSVELSYNIKITYVTPKM